MRWTAVVLGLALGVATIAGCKQPLFNPECDIPHYYDPHAFPGILPHLESMAEAGHDPAPDHLINTPMTVLDTDRKPRYISLQECIAIALEQGTNAVSQPNQPGLGAGRFSDQVPLIGFVPNPITDAMRVLALNPALAEAAIDQNLSRFDAQWVSSMTWSFTDVPFGGSQFSFLAGQSALAGVSQYRATPTTGIIKPLPTGGTAGITFSVPYSDFNPAFGRLNPQYAPLLHFGFEQPLLQGFGVEINQLRPTHPGAFLDPNLQTRLPFTGNDGIVLARLRFDQSRANFEANVMNLTANVEAAYWNLYGAYAQLYASEQALIQALAAWRINETKLKAGTQRRPDEAQSRGQYELFRGNRLQSLDTVLESERQLRGFMGLPMEDGCRLIPSDPPTVAPYRPDWKTSLREALSLRPELVLAREELKIRQMELIRDRNALLPDVRFVGEYEINSLGQSLAGAGAENAFRNLASNRFNNWTIGLNAVVPIGFRFAHSQVRITRLNLAQAYYTLRDAEYRTTRYLTLQYRTVLERYELIKVRRAQREAFAEQLRLRFQLYQAGVQQQTLDVLLEAQRFWADAFASEAQAIVDYNIALANFEYAKGTLLRHDNITIAEGPLPGCAAAKASDHLKARTLALVALERAVPQAPLGPGDHPMTLPEFKPGEAPSLPSLFMGVPQPVDDSEPLLSPKLAPKQGPELPKGIEPQQPDGPTLPPTASGTPVSRPSLPSPVKAEAPRPAPRDGWIKAEPQAPAGTTAAPPAVTTPAAIEWISAEPLAEPPPKPLNKPTRPAPSPDLRRDDSSAPNR